MTTRRSWPWTAALGGVTAVFLAANHLLVRGRAFGAWDAEEQAFPFFTLVADHVRAGRFATWDPWTTAGLPIMGEPQVAVFSPLTNLAAFATGGGAYGYVLYWLLIWWLGGVGMLLLARHLGAPAWGAAVVALGYLFSGVYAGNAEHMSWVTGFSFIPWIIWRFDAGLVTRRWLPIVQAGALWGLSGLTAYPGLVILTGGFVALWGAGRWLEGTVRVRGAIEPPIVVLLVGVLVLVPAYFAFFYEGAGVHDRVGALTRDEARSDQLDPAALVTFATPRPAALKAEHRTELFPSSDVSMTNIYAGLLVPALALLALTGRRGRWRWYLALLALLALATAMGETLPLRGWLYDLLLPLRYFKHSSIFRLYFVFTLCVLAALGVGDLARSLPDDSRALRRMSLVSWCLAVIAIGMTAWFVWHAWSMGLVGRREVVYAAGWVLVAAVVSAAAYLPAARRATIVPLLLLLTAAADGIIAMRISRPTMIRQGPAYERWLETDAAHSGSLDLTANGLFRAATSCDSMLPVCKRYEQMITKVPSFDTYTSQRHAAHRAMVSDSLLRAAAIGSDRIWFAREVGRAPPTAEAFTGFQRRAHELGAVPLIVHAPEEMLYSDDTEIEALATSDPDSAAGAIARLPAAERIAVELVAYDPRELALTVEAPADGWLLVTDRWARSWRARVNGADTPVHGGNFIFRAVPVVAGTNAVSFSYRPALHPWLAYFSGTVLAIVALASLRGARTPPGDARYPAAGGSSGAGAAPRATAAV